MKIATLLTNNYPPVSGGVSRFYTGLVQNSGGCLDVQTFNLGDIPSTLPHRLWSRLREIAWSIRFSAASSRHVHLVAGQPHLAIGPLLTGRRFSLAIHGGEWESFAGGRASLRALMCFATSILCSSEATRVAWIPQRHHHKALSIRPGVPDFGVRMLASKACRDRARRQGPFKVLCVARESSRKGILRLAQAVQSLTDQGLDVSLGVVGQSGSRTGLELLSYPVRFFGFVPDAELIELYMSADVFAMLPETLEGREGWEGFGIVFLEAAAAGLPVLATTAGGIREATDPSGSYLLPEQCSYTEVAEALKFLLLNPDVCQAMGTRNKAFAQENLWEARSPVIESWLSRLIS